MPDPGQRVGFSEVENVDDGVQVDEPHQVVRTPGQYTHHLNTR